MRCDKTLGGLGATLLLALSFAGQRGAEAAPPVAPLTAPAAVPKAGATAVKGTPVDPVAAPPVLPAPPLAVQGPGPLLPAATDGATHAVRLRDLAERIDELKEKIRHHHTLITLLSDSILEGGGASARASIRFSSELGGAFRVNRVLVMLDGAVYYNQADPVGTLAEPFQVPVFTGLVPPGDHTVHVVVNVQGNGHGVFTYLRGYRFEVRSTRSFTAIEGKTTNLEAISFEKGNATTPFEERPALRYAEKIVAGVGDASSPPAQSATPQR